MIRTAQPQDLPDLLDLLRLFHKEAGMSDKFSKHRTQSTLESLMESSEGAVFCMLNEGRVVGLLLGACIDSWFSQDKVGIELAWFVHKNYRKGLGPIRLIKSYEEWARNLGCSRVALSYLEGATNVALIYNRLGYKKTELSYMKDL